MKSLCCMSLMKVPCPLPTTYPESSTAFRSYNLPRLITVPNTLPSLDPDLCVHMANIPAPEPQTTFGPKVMDLVARMGYRDVFLLGFDGFRNRGNQHQTAPYHYFWEDPRLYPEESRAWRSVGGLDGCLW